MTAEGQAIIPENSIIAGQVEEQVLRLAQSIDFNSILSIQAFGGEIAEAVASYADKMLDAARSSDLNDTGEKLNQIVVIAQGFNLQSLDNPIARTPLIGGFLKLFFVSKEKVMARFETVKTQVDKLVSNVDTTAELLNQRNHDYQAMYEGVRGEYELLGLHIVAVERRLSDLDVEIGGLDTSGNDLETLERFSMLQASRNVLSKRADDLKMLQHSAMQTLPMVRIIQSNNLTLIDKFQTIRQLTLPAWKRNFMLALTLDEQSSATKLANTIDDATNSMMRQNADLLHQNSVATAKSNQRLVIDIDTLRHVHDTILVTLKDVRTAHADGAIERKKAIVELERLRAEMVEGVKAIGSPRAS
jgi:uncharacterized protein YaaN involved in tellurite resistance